MELIKDIAAPDEFDIIQSTIHLMKQSSNHHIDLYKLILQLISGDISPELSSAIEFIIKYLSQLIQTPTHMRAVDIFKELVTSILEDNLVKINLILDNLNQDNILTEIKKISECMSIKELTPEILHQLIEKVEISEDGSARIYYRFSLPSVYL